MMFPEDLRSTTPEVQDGQKGKVHGVSGGQSELLALTDARKLENLLKRQKGGAGFYTLTALPRS